MSSVDNRVVKMQFDNATFKKEALATKSSLDAVDAAVEKAGKGKGLLSMGKGMETVAVKASAMQIAAVTAIANIANRAVDAGINIAKSLTLDPIKAGFDEYELKMKSIQTILANTKGESLKSVTKVLNELNEYSDKTIYNFGNMTDAIGKLTTAGINLKTATSVVKGFHNMVALAGGDSNAAAGAMEQFNQGLQAGVIKLIDWKSLQTRGLGSQALQKSFFETGRAMGTITDLPVDMTFEQWTKSVGGFNGSLESGWLTADVVTKSMGIMAGEVKTVKELMAEGFTRKAAEDLLEIAKNAEESATKVRTMTAFMSTLKEQLGSGWSQVMEIIFGDFDEATNLFTTLSDKSGKLVGTLFDGIEGLLKSWDKLGGRAAIFTTISHLISPFAAIFSRIGQAIEFAFGGGKGGSFLATFSKALEHLTRPLNILGKLIRGELTPLEALLRLFEVGVNAVKNFARFVGNIIEPIERLVGIKLPSGGGFFAFLSDLADEVKAAIKQVDALIQKGVSLQDALGSVDIKMPKLPGLPDIPKMDTGGLPDLNSMFSGFSTNGATSELDQVSVALAGVSAESENATTVGDKVMPAVQGAWDSLRNFFKGFNVEDLMAAFNLAVLTTFLIQIGNFFNGMSKALTAFADVGGGFAGVLNSAGDALGSFQTAARAKLILAIGIAIGILAVSMWILSRIPADDIVKALTALSGIMIILKVGIGAITKAVEKMDGKGTTFKLTALSLALVALGVAILLLATAFLILNKVDWTSMLKGLGTIFIVMKLLENMGKLGEGGAKNLLGTAVALSAVAFSMVILAGALMLFKLVDWESMGKAGVALAGITLAVGALALIPYEGIAKVGVALLAASVGMIAIATALIMFALVEWESIGKAAVVLGLLTLSLLAITILGGPATVSGVVGLAFAMVLLAGACILFNSVDWESIAKAGVVLLGLVVGFALFAAVLTVFLYAIAPVAPVLMILAAGFFLFGLGLLAFAGAMAVAITLGAAGVAAFAALATGAAVAIGVFLQTLALQAPIMKKSFLMILQTLIDTVVEAVPMIIDGFKRLFAAIKKEFSGGGEGGGKMQASMSKSGESWISKLADGIKKKIPLIVDKAIDLLVRFIGALSARAQELGAKGAELVANLINGIGSRIDLIVTAATNLIIKFAEGIASNYSRILQAGVTLIAEFLHRLADTIRSGSAAIGGGIKDVVDAMQGVGVDMVRGLIAGLQSMVGDALGAMSDLAGQMIGKAKDMFKVFSPSRVFRDIGAFLVSGLTKGIQDNAAAAITATASMVGGSIAVASAYVDEFVQRLDQQAIAAMGKATGLQRAAEKAAKAAEKTKGKKDNKAADKLGDRADKAAEAADKAEARAEAAAEKADRDAAFAEADTFDKAKMRSEDAQSSMDAAKVAETRAVASLAEAAALEKQAKADGVTKKQRKEMLKQAEKLREQAEAQAKSANAQIKAAQTAAGDALALQKLAGDEAAREFEARYASEFKADSDAEAFSGYSDEAKAADLRRRGNELQAKADADFARAKELAYSDLEAANELMDAASASADAARDFINEAEQYEEEIVAKRVAADRAVQDFQASFDKEAKDDADVAAFNKLTDAQKAVERRRQAAELQAKAQKDLSDAKTLAYTDLAAANALAQEANQQADQARAYLDEAVAFEEKVAQGSGAGAGQVVNLDSTEAASIAFNKFNDLYSDAAAAASGGSTVEFNQYNTSPEALNPSDVYRQSNNLLSFAASKLQPTG